MRTPARFAPHAGALLAALATAALAGDLDPPAGAVAPTMKDLEDVEPRVPIRNDFDTLTPIVISERGSYYLAENITALFGEHAIEITASNVTLDLNGLTVEGNTEVGSLSGIKLTGAIANVTIVNGTVQFFFERGIDALLRPDVRIEGVRVIGNGQQGILVGDRAIITRCSAINNGSQGINCDNGSVVESCKADGNGSTGILVGAASIVRACASRGNDSTGIGVGPASTVSRCACESNGSNGISSGDDGTVTSCSVRQNTQRGIAAGDGSVISGCVAKDNGDHGILVNNRCLIRDNLCTLNGSASGIHVVGVDNRIEGNTVTQNDVGLEVAGSGNIVVRNSASGNNTNFSIGGDNDAGAIVFTPVGAGPWDNFEF